MMCKYSVLMSVYYKENPEFLQQSLDSMLNQTLYPDEIVLVKDGQLTYELEKVITKFDNENPGLFKIIALEKNIGLGRALDIGLNYCNNELIARMDSDDISLRERCEAQIEIFKEKPHLSIVGTMIDEFYNTPENVVSTRRVPTNNNEIYKFMKRRSPFNHPTVMFKKSDVINNGGYGKMRRKQDLDLFSRMINNGCIAENIDKSLLLFRSNEDNFKRRQSWDYVKSYINVQYEILKRGHCSIVDFIYVLFGQLTLYCAPRPILKVVSQKLLRA